MPCDDILPLTDEAIQILGQNLTAFSEAAKGKFGCTAVVHNWASHMDVPTASVSGRNKGAGVRYTKQLLGSVKISVWKDDLTTHKVDAVVNAANELLSHGGGLALALSRAGGPEIQQSSDKLIKAKGRVRTGDAVVSTAGKLPCKMIIHAVGPSVSKNPSQKEVDNAQPLLQSVIWNILILADHNNLRSVAIPAISSGIYNFPLHLCASIIVTNVKAFNDQRHPNSPSLEVRLVNNDDPSVNEMLRACQQYLGPSDTRTTGAVQSQSTSSTKSAHPSLKLGNVTLFLKEGIIQEEPTDVIVNTIGLDLSLSAGYVSNAILQKAGKRIQYEVIENGYRVSNGDVIETSGHNLKSKAVYHAILAASSPQMIHKVITSCLEMTEARGFSSISFPAIGTGRLGFKKEEVSQLMIQAVEKFAKRYKGRKLEVYFVIYFTETDKFEAFQKELESVKIKSPKLSSNNNNGSSVDYSEIDTETIPLIEFHADSPEALREAKAWAVGMLDKQPSVVTIQNNHVIHFGQKDHENLMSLQTLFGVSVTEFVKNGKCGITINGNPTGVSCAALKVEAMLCRAQEEFAQAEENDLLHSVVCWQAFPGSDEPETNAALEKEYLAKNDSKEFTVNGQKIKIDFRRMQAESQNGGGVVNRISVFSLYKKSPVLKSNSYYERSTIDHKSNDSEFFRSGLEIVKVEKIENNALRQVFELNKKRLSAQPKQMYQRVKAQFCELISRVGFQREYAPPEDQYCGAGIYFTAKLKKALELWQDDDEEQYIYIIKAQVLTGRSSLGSPKLIIPPFTGDSQVQYHSVCDDQRDTFVVFNGQQALPEYIYTCTKKHTGPDMSSASNTSRGIRK